jgi:hypothetical protein
MWEILHWIFMYIGRPNPVMHWVASMVLGICAYRMGHKLNRRDIIPSLCLLLTYVGFYIDPRPEHFAFQPWWTVSIIGLRQRELLIFFGGVMTGTYLLLSTRSTIVAHIIINLSTMGRIRKISFKSRALVHFVCICIYVNDPKLLSMSYRDVLMGTSAAFCGMIHTHPDWLSLGMVFTSPTALMTFMLHALEPNWFKYYRNNNYHFVKGSFYYIFPIAVCVLAFGWNVSSMHNLPS